MHSNEIFSYAIFLTSHPNFGEKIYRCSTYQQLREEEINHQTIFYSDHKVVSLSILFTLRCAKTSTIIRQISLREQNLKETLITNRHMPLIVTSKEKLPTHVEWVEQFPATFRESLDTLVFGHSFCTHPFAIYIPFPITKNLIHRLQQLFHFGFRLQLLLYPFNFSIIQRLSDHFLRASSSLSIFKEVLHLSWLYCVIIS